MNNIQVERINNYVRDMTLDEAQHLVGLLPSKLMSDELARRERLKTDKLTAINLILQAK